MERLQGNLLRDRESRLKGDGFGGGGWWWLVVGWRSGREEWCNAEKKVLFQNEAPNFLLFLARFLPEQSTFFVRAISEEQIE